VAVADGISGGSDGDRAAELAIEHVRAELGVSRSLDADALRRAAGRANAAVADYFAASGTLGGTTLTVAALARNRVEVVAIGDSPAYLAQAEGWCPITPPHSGPLTEFVGRAPEVAMWQSGWSSSPSEVVTLLVCSDGVRPQDDPLSAASPPGPAVHALLTGCRTDDDATAAVVRRHPVGLARPTLHLSLPGSEVALDQGEADEWR
jgi:hypothetical protein